MKTIKTAGIVIFLIGFALFNALFFGGRYTLTADVIRQHVADPAKADLLQQHSEGLLHVAHGSSFSFVSALHSTFEKANKAQGLLYGITPEDIATLTQQGTTFTLTSVDSAFEGSESVVAFKRKVFKDYAGWLDGRSFASREEMAAQLGQVADNLSQFAIVSALGFDRYAVKELSYALAKASLVGPSTQRAGLFLFLTFCFCIAGAFMYILPKAKELPGIKNNGIFFHPLKSVKWLGIGVGTWLIAFYVFLYFFPEYMTAWVALVDPLSRALSGNEAGRFFLYGFLYTLCVLVMGVRLMLHYRHSRYQLLRTASVMFFQTAFAFLIPEILVRLNQPYFDFKNIWPLDYSFFFDYRLNQMVDNGTLGLFMLGWGIALIIIGVPVLVYFFGKRWYCSWVCGCGGLAETLGDPYRQLSNKSVKAWHVERWLIHAVLVFAVVMTGGVLYTYFTGSSYVFFFNSYQVREWYGAFIGAGFAGVVGTGFYPLMGNRVWCRFGCPLAAYLGLVQRFKSRFRITTNGGQCISCGNCSTYCEMGIDVRWYAQRGQNIVRSSCVGCGICSSVCPRGVLNLEVKDEDGRFGQPVLIGNNGVKLAD
ncbi:MAG: 4Fe-4S binding protein [Cyclobacteriaceae bacterium]|jgi:Pyruvate/2-oxoacid:ferredoxin oxidoreductase delta subunit|nr:4Fe-4S binding protein [Cyclobacteriaceae bacterium]